MPVATLNADAKNVTFAGADPTGEEAATPEQDGINDAEPEFGVEFKKKKKKSKSKMKKGEDKPTGFENYYVDPPLTVEEFDVEKGLYDPSRTFSSRIQTALQRFSARRKFGEDRRNIWTKYLRYGGIDTGPKMFGGLENDVSKGDEVDQAGDVETLKAKEFVSEDVLESQLDAVEKEEDSNYAVDFDGVVKGFLSLHIQGTVSLRSEQLIKTYTGVIRNWLNYLLHHNVCNEYKDQIYAARVTCDVADKELWALERLGPTLPGHFSEACRAIYTPPAASNKADEWTWDGDPWSLPSNMDRDLANRTFLAALAALGDDTLIERYQAQNQTEMGTAAIQDFDTGLEVTAIERPTEGALFMYRHDSSHGLTPTGKIRAKTWYMDWEILPDLTEEEEAALPAKREAERRDYEFWVDENVLATIFVGLKMVARVKELNFGIWYLDNVKHIFPSFVTWLPNEVMIGWRDHEYLPPDREKLLEKIGIRNDEPDPNEGNEAPPLPADENED